MPPRGIEPRTFRLQGGRNTTMLKRLQEDTRGLSLARDGLVHEEQIG